MSSGSASRKEVQGLIRDGTAVDRAERWRFLLEPEAEDCSRACSGQQRQGQSGSATRASKASAEGCDRRQQSGHPRWEGSELEEKQVGEEQLGRRFEQKKQSGMRSWLRTAH